MTRESAQRATYIDLLFVIFASSYGVASYLLAEALARGSARLEPWKQAILAIGDLVALGFFIRFFVVHAVFGRSFSRPTLSEFRNTERWRTLAFSLGSALLIDLALTFYFAYEEHTARERALTATANVLEVRQRTKPRPPSQVETLYRITYEFKDQRGTDFRGMSGCSSLDGKFVDTNWPPAVQEQLRKSQSSFKFIVEYDPNWPARNWPQAIEEGVLGSGGNNLIAISLMNAIIGFSMLAFFMLDLWRFMRNNREVPWWHELYQTVPFMGQAAVFLALAIAVRWNGFDMLR